MANTNKPENTGKNPKGRPNIYKNTFFTRDPAKAGQPGEYTPNQKAWDKLAKLINKGLTNEQLAVVYDVEENAIYDWQDKYDDFSEALDKNKRRYDDGRVVRSLYERANGFKGKETKAFVIQGKIQTVEVEKHFAPDTTAIQTWLYNRQPEQWRSINHIDYTSKPQEAVTQYDYSKLSIEEMELFEYLLKKMTV